MNINKIITMAIVKTTYKYRAYPSKEHKEILNRQMFLAKELYNMLLEKSKAYQKGIMDKANQRLHKYENNQGRSEEDGSLRNAKCLQAYE